MCIPIYSKIATCTNFVEYFFAAKTEMRHENFSSFNHNCRSCNLRIVAMCVYVCTSLQTFFLRPSYPYDRDKLRDESRVFARRVTRESCSVLEIQGKGWAKAMVAGKCDEGNAKIKSTRGTNKMSRKEGLMARRTFRRASRLRNISRRRLGVWLRKRNMSLDLAFE